LDWNQEVFVIRKSTLIWFIHIECKDDAVWMKCCTAVRVWGVREWRPMEDMMSWYPVWNKWK